MRNDVDVIALIALAHDKGREPLGETDVTKSYRKVHNGAKAIELSANALGSTLQVCFDRSKKTNLIVHRSRFLRNSPLVAPAPLAQR